MAELMYPAYENYLVNQAEKIMSNFPEITNPICIISDMLLEACRDRHPMAFDLVGLVCPDGKIDVSTSFNEAAKKIYDDVIENRKK